MIAVDFVGAAIGLVMTCSGLWLVYQSVQAFIRDRRGEYIPGDATVMGFFGLWLVGTALGVWFLIYAVFFR